MDVGAFQDKIRQLDGVEAARVVASNGHVDEIHVLARRNKPAKQLVRDIQSLALALFSMNIDRRIVSVVQLADADIDQGLRPALVDVSENLEGTRAEITVTLRWQDSLLIGKTSGAAANAIRPRLVSEAAIGAIRQAVDPAVALGVSSVDIVTLGSRRMAIAQIVLVTEARERMLIGAAYVDEDDSRASVRAVLDALNRFLPSLKVE
ncbi:MAG: hypothetical protein DIU67_007720 [Actinomycetes bacterium]